MMMMMMIVKEESSLETFPVRRLVGQASKNDKEQHCGAFTVLSTVRYLRATRFDLLGSEANQLLFTNSVSKFVDIFFSFLLNENM